MPSGNINYCERTKVNYYSSPVRVHVCVGELELYDNHTRCDVLVRGTLTLCFFPLLQCQWKLTAQLDNILVEVFYIIKIIDNLITSHFHVQTVTIAHP